MASFPFIDEQGTAWMILAGLPADHPDIGEHGAAGGLLDGISFRASTGEVRVLPRAVIPRRASLDIQLPSLGKRTPVRRLEPMDWEELLRHAIVWPPA